MRGDIAHHRRDLQHLHRMGQPMMRKPQRSKPCIARRPNLLDDLRDMLGDVEAFRKLRVDEQTDLHDGLSCARSAQLPSSRPALPRQRARALTSRHGGLER
jgi:hypothetical protein